jgi:uncharacterized protein YjbJ (UPF0337 family)
LAGPGEGTLPADDTREENAMAGEMDEAKGRFKEAAGDLTDDEELQREGKVDKGTGKVKEFVEKISEKIKGK